MISVGGSSMRERTSRMSQPGRQADDQAADAAGDELEARLPEREGAGDHGGDGEAVEDQRGPVVGEVLALDDRDQAPRRARRAA